MQGKREVCFLFFKASLTFVFKPSVPFINQGLEPPRRTDTGEQQSSPTQAWNGNSVQLPKKEKPLLSRGLAWVCVSGRGSRSSSPSKDAIYWKSCTSFCKNWFLSSGRQNPLDDKERGKITCKIERRALERKAWRSQPALAMKTTPFRPACQQSPVITSTPKPPRHFHPLSTCESGSPVPSLLSWNQHQPRGPPSCTRSGCFIHTWLSWTSARHLHVPSRAVTPSPASVPPPPPAPAPPTAPGARAQTPRHQARPLGASPLPVPRPSLAGEAWPGRERARRRSQ